MLDSLTHASGVVVLGGWQIDAYSLLFVSIAVLLGAAVFLTRRISEPDAR